MIKLRLKEYSINNDFSIVEFTNDARNDPFLSKYEYWIYSKNSKKFVFGCNSRFDADSIKNLVNNGYFDSYMEVK